MQYIVMGSGEALTRFYQSTYHWTRAHNHKGGELVTASWPLTHGSDESGRILILNPRIAEGAIVLECLAVAAGVKCFRQVV